MSAAGMSDAGTSDDKPKVQPQLHVFYGGTFDPVHDGHLAIARAARERLQADIRLMPADDPPHRPPPGASAADRAQMLRLAIADEPGLRLDLREFERGGRSYSVDTLHALRAELGPDAPIALLLGADSFLDLPQWKSWRELFALAHFVVASRPGSPLDAPPPAALEAQLQGREVVDAELLRSTSCGRVLFLDQSLHGQSATRIRQRIASGLPWQDMLPAAVVGYIAVHGLYGAGPDGDGSAREGDPAVIRP